MIVVQDVLLSLVRLGLNIDEPTDLLIGKIRKLSQSEWDLILNISNQQGVTAICTDGLDKVAKVISVPKQILLKFVWIRAKTVQSNIVKSEVTEKLCSIFSKSNIPMLVLKGSAISRFYPEPKHRYCGDIDIYLGENYKRGNIVLLSNGYKVLESYYRHSEAFVDGVMIENHCLLSELGVEDNNNLEKIMRQYADQSLGEGEIGKPILPNPNFNSIFLSWHSSSHFMFEEVSLRQIIDWAMFLMHESHDVDIQMFRQVKSDFRFGKFADIMTALAIDYLKIPIDSIPIQLIVDAHIVDVKLVCRVFDYMMQGKRIDRSNGTFKLRWELMKLSWNDSWKFNDVYGISYSRLMFRKVISVLTGHKRRADI